MNELPQKEFFHALTFRRDLCIGCTHCMQVCPTEAIRVKNGKAQLFEHRCVDCGECYRACPVCAISIDQDDLEQIFRYKIRVALLPSVFIGQFNERISTGEIFNELLKMGFTHIYEIDRAVDILMETRKSFLSDSTIVKPQISPYCPAIVRLIQVKFPSLVKNLLLLKPPIDIAAWEQRKKFEELGYDQSDVGLFYITPCAAKIAAIKDPVGETRSEINGVINMNFIYNKVLTGINKHHHSMDEVTAYEAMSAVGCLYSLTRGEIQEFQGRALAIDGIHHVIDFLELLENEDDINIDFLELRACDESCAGGILNSCNRFLIVERLFKLANYSKNNRDYASNERVLDEKYYHDLFSAIVLSPIQPRSMMKLDNDRVEAMKKIRKIKELLQKLPNIDCGVCGCPSCSALAEDIVQQRGTLDQCVFFKQFDEEKNDHKG